MRRFLEPGLLLWQCVPSALSRGRLGVDAWLVSEELAGKGQQEQVASPGVLGLMAELGLHYRSLVMPCPIGARIVALR